MNIACDIEEIKRFRYLQLSKKILSISELKIFNKLNNEDKKRDFLAGRWCAKEAIKKLLSKSIFFREINIEYVNKKPVWLKKHNEIKISISHCRKYAMAVAIMK